MDRQRLRHRQKGKSVVSFPMRLQGRHAINQRLLAVRADYDARGREPAGGGTRQPAGNPQPPRGAGQRAGAGVVVFGLLLFAAGAAVLLIHALLVGDGEFITVGLVMLAIPLVLAALAARFGSWALVLATVGGALGVLGNAPSLLHGLGSPDSFFDFVPSLFALAGGLVAAVGGVVTLARRRRARGRTGTASGPRAALGLTAVLGALALLSGVLTVAGRESVSAATKEGATPVKVEDGLFKTDLIEVNAGTPTRLLVQNDDVSVHSFTITALGIDRGLGPGSEYIVALPALEPGSYTYICNVPNHENMKGTLVVR